ncbi:signal-regulatory gamma-like [Pelobates cultripes]|uniref:Signal-regulatory gamma-like n=1 Tax=Pelobates cultripes TaxID=61616 RepID=A0AAD1WJF9_PELCU|nr:signal-regulatory gamma-like [Pelobates cultripes]
MSGSYRLISCSGSVSPRTAPESGLSVEKVLFNHELSNQPNLLKCKISGYNEPDELTVTWLKQEHEETKAVALNPSDIYQIPDLTHEMHEDKTSSCTACLDIKQSLSSEEATKFICRVEHPSLGQPIERDWDITLKGESISTQTVHYVFCVFQLCAEKL